VSASIRPPAGSTPGSAGIGELPEAGAASELQGAEAASPSGVGRSEASRSEAARSAEPSPTSSWIQRLEAREISRAEAIEGLVAQALETHGGARLPPAQRSELEGLLRSALLEDPVLGRLLGGG
jgi:hypothetical protein